MVGLVAHAFDDVHLEYRPAGEVAARRVVDAVHIHRSRRYLRTKRIDEPPADAADSGRLGGTASEDDVDVGTCLRSGRRDDHRQRGNGQRGSDDHSPDEAHPKGHWFLPPDNPS